jgi:hypothetical protein
MIDLDKLGIIAGSIVAGAGVFYRAYQLTAGKKKTPRVVTAYSSIDDDTKDIVVVNKSNGNRYVSQSSCHEAMDDLKKFVHEENKEMHQENKDIRDKVDQLVSAIGDTNKMVYEMHGRMTAGEDTRFMERRKNPRL